MQETQFIQCGIAIDSFILPDGTTGKRIIVIDQECKHSYIYPMDDSMAKDIGAKLIGMGDVKVAGLGDLAQLQATKKNGSH